MIPAKPKPIKLEGKNLGWRDSTARAELKSMLMNVDDNWEYLTMPAEELQKLRPSFKEQTKSQFKEYVITLKGEKRLSQPMPEGE